jgi:hypothetical protein
MPDEPRLTSAHYRQGLERVSRLNRRETMLTDRLYDRVDTWVDGWLASAHNIFHRDFHNRWDLLTARRTRAHAALTSSIDESLGDLATTVETDLEQGVTDGYNDGYRLTLWDAYRAGVVRGDELETYVDPPSDGEDDGTDEDSNAHLWLAAAAIGGLALQARTRRWFDDMRLRMRTGVQSSIAGESTIYESDTLFQTLAEQFAGRLSVLGQSELQRGFFGGQTALLTQLDPDVMDGELWWSRLDNRVCPVCLSLHGTITPLTPIADTHPRCRCVKVPLWKLVDNTEGLPTLGYDEFLQLLGVA